MRNPFCAILCALLLAAAFAPREAAANLLLDGDFTGVKYSQTTPVLDPNALFGQVGPDTPVSPATTSPASGATLTLNNWTTNGYNFVFEPGTADSGTSNGANTGAPKEAPGQFVSGSYGNTYLWGTGNASASSPTIPVGALPTANAPTGNFMAMDGAYEQGSVNQSISNLTLGAIYRVSFSWAGAQQEGTNFNSATSDQFRVSLGTTILTTASTIYQQTGVVNVAPHSSSAWMTQTFDFTATAATQILSFLAVGTPNGQPPFALLGGVSLDMVPEPSSWTLFVGAGAAFVLVAGVRRRRAAGRMAAAGE